MKVGKKDEIAVSNVIGTMLMLALAITLIIPVSLTVMNYDFGDVSISPEIIGFIQGDNIILEHRGGKSLDFEDLVTIGIGGILYEINLSQNVSDLNHNSLWDVGEWLAFSQDTDDMQVEVIVVESEKNSLVFNGVLQEGVNYPVISWVQTSRADFESGILTSLDAESSPGELWLTSETDHIYAFGGNNNIDFWRYTISNNTWSSMANAPDTINSGSALVYDGNYIYALRGKNNVDFWRYDIENNTWSSKANAPENVQGGGDLIFDGNDIYGFRGNNNVDFWRYNIENNTWSSMANAPDTVNDGGDLSFDGDYIYALRGGNNDDFWRYDKDSDTWSALSDTPFNVNFGGDLCYDGTYIYALRGANKDDFWRYEINTDTWSSMSDTPENIQNGGALSVVNSLIYAFRGGNNNDFYRYNISSNTWGTLQNTPDLVNNGGTLTSGEQSYTNSGSIISSIKDCGESSTITSIQWTETRNDQMITFQIRSDDDADMSSPSPWENVTNGDTLITTPAGRYIQYKASFSTSDPLQTPILKDVTIRYYQEGG